MADQRRRLRSVLGPIVAAGLAIASIGLAGPAAAADGPPAWHGGIDLYRDGTYTVQKDWIWCTAAGVQIMRNIVDLESDHTTTAQRRYFAWMRPHDRYRLPLSGGVDPQGWAAGLRHFVDDRYRLVASTTFDGALRSAVRRLRQTNLPVALTVSHGNHGWILTGFTASTDPLTSASFQVTSVRVVGPLYGLQSRNGYDMAPDTKLTPTQLRRFFTPWKYAPMSMVWDGRYVSIQPVPVVLALAPAAPPAVTMPWTSGPDRAGTALPIPRLATAIPRPAPTGQAAAPDRVGAGAAADAVIAAALLIGALLVLASLLVRRRATGPLGPPRFRTIR